MSIHKFTFFGNIIVRQMDAAERPGRRAFMKIPYDPRSAEKMERMRVRTDLALEANESVEGRDTEVHGVVVEED